MARKIGRAQAPEILAAAERWIDTCLVEDGSVFATEPLWTEDRIALVTRAFVDHPDTSDKSFLQKLEGQLASLPPDCHQLAAELLWVLLLFPSNASVETKRDQIVRIWGAAGPAIPASHPLLADFVLSGIGSGGTAYFVLRPLELEYLLSVVASIKSASRSERLRRLKDYDAFISWIDSVPETGERQFKHMLRYFAFPDRVERMASAGERRRALVTFGVGTKKDVQRWNDRELDEQLLALRRRLEAEAIGRDLDFYIPPLRERWLAKAQNIDHAERATRVSEVSSISYSIDSSPKNIIAYGPPGTGKTWWMRQKAAEYTDQPGSVDRETWLNELLGDYGWRPVIAVALSELKQARVPELRAHRLVQAKARERNRAPASILQTLWSYLREHTPEDAENVKTAIRREPFIFAKSNDGQWSVVDEWREFDEEATALAKRVAKGPAGSEPVRRYVSVTFHPSYSYEDFVRGIRPVTSNETTTFQLVDGAFATICDRARRNPSKRYALFIDEINRANIAKVFGELISLIEIDKRATYDTGGRIVSGMTAQLPGGAHGEEPESPFGVPANLDIYGTMNTADRSIALLDVALRRRFQFIEIAPDYSLLDAVEGVDAAQLLRTINDRLEMLIDRDHRIGHAYLIGVSTLAKLRKVFHAQIIPLLYEYFFEDASRVHTVLSQFYSAPPLVGRVSLDPAELLPAGANSELLQTRVRHEVTAAASWTAATFQAIYSRDPRLNDEPEQ